MVVQIIFIVISEEYLAGHSVQDWLVDLRRANLVIREIVVLIERISNRCKVDRRLVCEPAVHAERWTPFIEGAVEAVLPHLV